MLFVLSPGALGAADEGQPHAHGEHHENAEEPTAADPYPLATCPVSGRELGSMGEPVVHEHEGREVRFCCAGCVEPFEDEAEAHIAEIDAQLIEQQLPVYPLEACPVSEQELGSMGEPVDLILGNRLVRLCCAGCEQELREDAATHFQTLNEAVIEQQRDDYPLEACPVSGRELGSMGEPVERVVAHRLVKLCCPMCEEAFEAEVAEHLQAVREAGSADGHEH